LIEDTTQNMTAEQRAKHRRQSSQISFKQERDSLSIDLVDKVAVHQYEFDATSTNAFDQQLEEEKRLEAERNKKK